MSRSDPPSLFLHGGPGFGTRAERGWLGDDLGIDWWEQPRFEPGEPEGYSALLRAARERVACLRNEHDAPVRLLASSFGCYLACDLARTIPEQLDSIVLLAPMADIRAAFARFAAALGVVPDTSGPDENARFWTLVGQVMAAPRFTDHYWSPGAVLQQQRFFDLMSDPGAFHFPTFQQVLTEYLARPANDAPARFRGPVSMVSGQFDLLACAETDEAAMRKLFPQLHSISLPTGHFPHLELGADCWLTVPPPRHAA